MKTLDSKYLYIFAILATSIIPLAISFLHGFRNRRSLQRGAVIAMVVGLALVGLFGAARNRDNPPNFSKRVLLPLVKTVKQPIYAQASLALVVNTYEQATMQHIHPWHTLPSNSQTSARILSRISGPLCVVADPSHLPRLSPAEYRAWYERDRFTDPLSTTIEVFCRRR